MVGIFYVVPGKFFGSLFTIGVCIVVTAALISIRFAGSSSVYIPMLGLGMLLIIAGLILYLRQSQSKTPQ